MPLRDNVNLYTLRLCVTPFLWISAIVIGTNDYLFEVTSINGTSMSPTLSPIANETGKRDWVLWNKLRPTKDLRRGDVVMYYSPLNPEKMALKRVIALGGDEVMLDKRRRPGHDQDGEVVGVEATAARNWDAMAASTITGPGLAGANARPGTFKVPFGHVWVEGDNWRKSQDSNHYGPISKSLIVGKAMHVVWPSDRAWTRPWEEKFKSRTRVVKGREQVPLAFEDMV